MAPATAAAVTVAALSLTSAAVLSFFLCNHYSNRSSINKNGLKKKSRLMKKGVIEAIGNTPLIRIDSLSDATGCEVW